MTDTPEPLTDSPGQSAEDLMLMGKRWCAESLVLAREAIAAKDAEIDRLREELGRPEYDDSLDEMREHYRQLLAAAEEKVAEANRTKWQMVAARNAALNRAEAAEEKVAALEERLRKERHD